MAQPANDTKTTTKGGGEQNLTVALRIRPLNEDENYNGAKSIAHKVQAKMVVLMDPMEDHDDVLRANRSREKQFVFDCTFDSNALQDEVYKNTTRSLLPNIINGYNATVFAYGATGAGKTYTMLGTDDEPGIMARGLNDLFVEMDRTKEEMKYKVSMSYLEIYNEMIRDLLKPSSGILDLREDAKGGVQVAGLSEVTTRSTNEVMDMLFQGNKERTQEPTAANKTSSRSHAVLQVIVKQQNRVRNTVQEVRVGKLFMVDLAGSERAAATHNRGKRMVEGAHINRSLLALGNCINALSDKNGHKYINYRDSKLTRLLKDALGGNCKTVMIAHISPASSQFEESRNTLVYADRAKHIKTKVRRNVTDVSYHIAQYTNIIQELREEIGRLRVKLNDKTTSVSLHGGSSIQAVQAQVLEAKRNLDKVELNKLKEQLLISFKDQMELRKSLMELNNATMEISLETNRNQMIITEWQAERAKSSLRKEGGDNAGQISKSMELAGIGSDEVVEPEEVKVARDEIKVLHDEKYRTEKIRTTVYKELEQAKSKTRKLEETVPQKISDEDQTEIVMLMCKVHELEIENTEGQSACLIRDFQIKKKDMVIVRFRQHRTLCDEIIRKQKILLEENNIPFTRDLEELMELYKLEKEDRMLFSEETLLNLTPEYRSKVPSVASTRLYGDGETDHMSALTEEEDHRRGKKSAKSEDKLFSQSAQARRIKEGTLSGIWRNNSNVSGPDDPPLTPTPRITPGEKTDRTVIATGTRNIAALAAKKRTIIEQKYGDTKSLYRPNSEKDLTNDSYLSQNMLAKHNKKFSDTTLPMIKDPSDDNLSHNTKNSSFSDSTLPPIRQGQKNSLQREADLKKNRRTRGNELGYSQQFGRGRRLSEKSNVNTARTGDRDLLSPVGYRNKTKRQGYRDSSNASTPKRKSKSKKNVPTIPSYRQGDITITGFAVPR
ncbi:kinesin-like protein KIF19 [Mytilus trossulus]|uniref:kinesin-like protein KIF19 n=1 Tax=Mytilus trossulus TaxID=6551 RepID=UPI00300547ED